MLLSNQLIYLKKLKKINKKKDTIFFGIFLKKNNKHIGNIKFNKINKKKTKSFFRRNDWK